MTRPQANLTTKTTAAKSAGRKNHGSKSDTELTSKKTLSTSAPSDLGSKDGRSVKSTKDGVKRSRARQEKRTTTAPASETAALTEPKTKARSKQPSPSQASPAVAPRPAGHANHAQRKGRRQPQPQQSTTVTAPSKVNKMVSPSPRRVWCIHRDVVVRVPGHHQVMARLGRGATHDFDFACVLTLVPHSRHDSPAHHHASNGNAPSPQKRRGSPNPTAPASPPSRPTRDHAYAGPTFSNSPAASRLPMPDFLLGSADTPSAVPSLSPSSSTTSLHQYSSMPPSPTRASPGIDLGICARESSETPQDDEAALRTRSRELLGLLRGAAGASADEPVMPTAAYPVPYPTGYASQPAALPMAHDPFLVERCAPPAFGFYDALGHPEQTGISWHSGAPAPAMIQSHYQHAPQPHPYMHHQPQPQAMMPPPPQPALPSHASSKSLINDMYSSSLRALLRLDVQA
ncbi:hypothetical protein THASP1DRAFT_21742 [Thamnocephalis sphaerospora]|uniref:Uncharacterized protein n=1 Tax=Thamnocephalis sphaerospora TaxID=78915 RepID=A0A4P9XW85_9FUNG|nr:hypothetical protein THASP1DRAFT_21742 [Thamnocephalis sphaerospora]|eukprot:RKP10583.1 hypothetical protein THASP1DRAFT_21742 [Thamnocephalis sphaerospora]